MSVENLKGTSSDIFRIGVGGPLVKRVGANVIKFYASDGVTEIRKEPLASPAVVSDTGATTTTGTSYVLMNGMSVTPGAGTYLVLFGATLQPSSTTMYITLSVYANGAMVVGSDRTIRPASASIRAEMSTFCVVTVAAGQAIEGRWLVTAGTGTATYRSMNLVRIAPEA